MHLVLISMHTRTCIPTIAVVGHSKGIHSLKRRLPDDFINECKSMCVIKQRFYCLGWLRFQETRRRHKTFLVRIHARRLIILLASFFCIEIHDLHERLPKMHAPREECKYTLREL